MTLDLEGESISLLSLSSLPFPTLWGHRQKMERERAEISRKEKKVFFWERKNCGGGLSAVELSPRRRKDIMLEAKKGGEEKEPPLSQFLSFLLAPLLLLLLYQLSPYRKGTKKATPPPLLCCTSKASGGSSKWKWKGGSPFPRKGKKERKGESFALFLKTLLPLRSCSSKLNFRTCSFFWRSIFFLHPRETRVCVCFALFYVLSLGFVAVLHYLPAFSAAGVLRSCVYTRGRRGRKGGEAKSALLSRIARSYSFFPPSLFGNTYNAAAEDISEGDQG